MFCSPELSLSLEGSNISCLCFAPQSSAWVWKGATSRVYVHNDPKNHWIKKGKVSMDEKPFWIIVTWSSCSILKHLLLVFEGSRAPIFAHQWAIGWWNNYTGLALQEGLLRDTRMSEFKSEMSFCLFGKAATFSFLGSVSPSLTNSLFLLRSGALVLPDFIYDFTIFFVYIDSFLNPYVMKCCIWNLWS